MGATADRAGHLILNLGIVYALVGPAANFYVFHLPGWAVVAPLFLLIIPGSALHLLRRCPHCSARLYTLDSLRKAPGGPYKFPTYRWKNCPACGHPLG